MAGGTPFPDYTIPALALGGVIGGGALFAAAMLVLRERWGVVLSLAVGAAMMIFEMVETLVVGWDVWLHAFGLKPTLEKRLPGVNASGVPAPMGVPLPLWLQPFYFVFGLIVIALALRLPVGDVDLHLPTLLSPDHRTGRHDVEAPHGRRQAGNDLGVAQLHGDVVVVGGRIGAAGGQRRWNGQRRLQGRGRRAPAARRAGSSPTGHGCQSHIGGELRHRQWSCFASTGSDIVAGDRLVVPAEERLAACRSDQKDLFEPAAVLRVARYLQMG